MAWILILDLDPDPDPDTEEVDVEGDSPLGLCTFDTPLDATDVELTDSQFGWIERMREF
jgi:hypothetical protein